jgi:hypothetical protein
MKSNVPFLFGYVISRTIADADATEITGVRNIKIFPKESGSKIFHTAERGGCKGRKESVFLKLCCF